MIKTIAACSTILICSVQLDAQTESYDGPIEVFPDTTVPLDSAKHVYIWESMPADCTYVVFLPYDETYCRDTTIAEIVAVDSIGENPSIVVIEWPSAYFPVITFADCPPGSVTSWLSGCWHGCGGPGDPWMLATDPFKGWHEIDLFGVDTGMIFTSLSSFSATNSRQISSSPHEETPEPPKPVPIPEQPWYEAVLPNPIRMRKS